MGRPKNVNTLDLNSEWFICKFCRKKKPMTEIAMTHISEGCCFSCMEKGW